MRRHWEIGNEQLAQDCDLLVHGAVSDFHLGSLLRPKRSDIPEQSARAEQFAKLAEQSTKLAE
jgi:hypothetical protein